MNSCAAKPKDHGQYCMCGCRALDEAEEALKRGKASASLFKREDDWNKVEADDDDGLEDHEDIGEWVWVALHV
jgi:hypothetical protein